MKTVFAASAHQNDNEARREAEKEAERYAKFGVSAFVTKDGNHWLVRVAKNTRLLCTMEAGK